LILPTLKLAGKLSLLLALPLLAALALLSWLDRGSGNGDVFATALAQSEAALAAPAGDFLARSYGVAGNWNFVPRSPPDFHDWLENNLRDNGAGPPPPAYGRQPQRPGGARQESLFHLERRIALLDADGRLIVGPPGSDQARGRWPIRLDGKVIGALTFNDADIALPRPAEDPGTAANRHLALVAGGGLLAALLLSWLLARSFNRLTERLSANERERRRFVADTSHELRTPIAVLRAQIEALQDGIHQADSGTLAVLHDDVMGLSRLVDDLYALARADAGGLKTETAPIDIPAILEDVAEGFAPRLAAAGLSLELSGRPETPWICFGDHRRMRQLFINLIENSVRYTDRGGTLAIQIQGRANTLVIRFDDSAPGVPDESLPRLFERFYRVEASRNRDQGGSGLGLAICQGIVAAHNGQISASASPRGGLRIEIVLPRGEEKRA
jgi:two-component system sensor histidine kinase BaeS